MPRRICIVTGSRADFGLLKWLMEEIRGDERLELQVAVTGMHLAPEFGLTLGEITASGIPIDREVPMLLPSDTPIAITKSVGLGTIGFADAFHDLAPDIVLVLGDRFEIFSAAQAAMLESIPLAHVHGGEVTEGAMDDSIRHAITKMASLHFVSAEPHRARVLRMGEPPGRVFTVGAPGLDALSRERLPERSALEAELGFSFTPLSFLVTYHAATWSDLAPGKAFTEILAALDEFPQANVLLTMPNADTGGREIHSLGLKYASERAPRVRAIASLGHVSYLAAARDADLVIGNSSSGLIEVPALGKPTVNVGARQKGRLRGKSVIDCAEDARDIARAIRTALDPVFRKEIAETVSPYGNGGASEKIKEVLATVPLAGLGRKVFYDGDAP